MDKAVLRQEFINRRLDITPSSRVEKSAQIHLQLMSTVDWTHIRRVHIYRSIDEWGEADTSRLIDLIKDRYPNVKIDIAAQNSSTPPPLNIDYDLVVVPVLAYDGKNNRLGMGSGWYDRFLAHQPRAYKIGLAFKESHSTELPVDNHDIALDIIIAA